MGRRGGKERGKESLEEGKGLNGGKGKREKERKEIR